MDDGTLPALTGLTQLQRFYVANNRFTGPIPSLQGLSALNSFLIGVNRLEGPVPAPPATLATGGSMLCPNSINSAHFTPSAAWDAATATTPWWRYCEPLFRNGFE